MIHEFTTILGENKEVLVRYKYTDAVYATREDDAQPAEVEIVQVMHNGIDLFDDLSDSTLEDLETEAFDAYDAEASNYYGEDFHAAML